jgi:hypothetical protein
MQGDTTQRMKICKKMMRVAVVVTRPIDGLLEISRILFTLLRGTPLIIYTPSA